jgi:hypothetical protein
VEILNRPAAVSSFQFEKLMIRTFFATDRLIGKASGEGSKSEDLPGLFLFKAFEE